MSVSMSGGFHAANDRSVSASFSAGVMRLQGLRGHVRSIAGGGTHGRGQVPVSGVRRRWANARHECFVMDASVSVRTAETAEMDESRSRPRRVGARLLSPWPVGAGRV